MGLGMWTLDLNLHPHKATSVILHFFQELFIDYLRNRECDRKQDLALWVSMETGTGTNHVSPHLPNTRSEWVMKTFGSLSPECHVVVI